MATELCALLTMTFFTLFAWLPGSIGKKKSYGMKWLAGNRAPSERPLLEWASRADRAYQNLKDYFPCFAVAILLLAHLDLFNPFTAVCAWGFVALRVLHMGFYIAGYPLMRALTWMLSMTLLVGMLIIPIIN